MNFYDLKNCNCSQGIVRFFLLLSLSGYRAPQMQGIGLRIVQVVREQTDNTADGVPCDRLRRISPDCHAFALKYQHAAPKVIFLYQFQANGGFIENTGFIKIICCHPRKKHAG